MKKSVLYTFLFMSVFAGSIFGQVTVTGVGYTTTNYTNLDAALDAAGAGIYIIDILADQELAPRVIAPGQNIILMSSSGSGRNVSLSSSGTLFRVSAGATFTLYENVTLIGRNGNNAPVVLVDGGGTFNIDGGKITGNTISAGVIGPYRAGGVGIDNDGKFNMYRGEISGNVMAGSGAIGGAGGVIVFGLDGVFNMSGGTISANRCASENSAGNGAGGVYISDGTFNMSGGTISANEQTGTLARAAGGVYLANAGKLNMSGGIIKDNTSKPSSNGNGDGVFVIGTSYARFSGNPRIEDGVFTSAALANVLRIDGPLSPAALITVQGSGAANQMTPNVNVTGTFSGVTESMANAFVSKDHTDGIPRLVGTVAGNRVVWAENTGFTLGINGVMNFGSAAYGYTTLQSVDIGHTMTVNNSGRATGELTITLTGFEDGGLGADAFVLSRTVIDNVEMNGQADFVIKTKSGLPAGTHRARVTAAGRYVIRSFEVEFEVMKARLVVSPVGAKTIYGEDRPVFTANYSGFVNGETPADLSGALIFNCGYTKGNGAGDYLITLDGLSSNNYNIQYMGNMLTVDKRPVGIDAVVSSKEYDRTTAAVVSSAIVNNKYGTDDVTAVPGTAAFVDKNAGVDKDVILSGWTLGGTKANNYTLTMQPAAKGNITPKAVTVSQTNIPYTGKVYDGTTDFTGQLPLMLSLTAASGIISGDVLTVRFTTASVYSSKDAGNRTVTFSGGTLLGPDAGNYSLSNPAVVKDVEITKRDLVIKANDTLMLVGALEPDSYIYTLIGLAEGETEAVISGLGFSLDPSYDGFPAAAKYIVTPSSAVADNYEITFKTGILTVSSKTNVSDDINLDPTLFIYDGTQQTPEVDPGTLGRSLDNLTYHYVGTSDNINADVYDSDEAPIDAGTYMVMVTYEDATHIGKTMKVFTIKPKSLTIPSTASHTKVYDGARNAYGVSVTLDGVIISDNNVSAAVTAMYTGTNAGTKSLNILSVKLTGANSHNYTVTTALPAPVTVSGGITPKPITAQMFTFFPQEYEYEPGLTHEPVPLAADGGNVMIQDADFELSDYSNNINPGTASLTVTGIGNYTGTLTLNFKITGDIGEVCGTISISDWTYGDEELTHFTVSSGANAIEYRERNAPDNTYTTAIPVNAGDYTVRAVFADCFATDDFTVFKAQQYPPRIPGIEADIPGTVLTVSSNILGISVDMSGINAKITNAGIDLLVDNSVPETAKWEYLINGGKWQDNPSWGSLKPNSEYTILIRKREDRNHFPSPEAAILVRTLAVGTESVSALAGKKINADFLSISLDKKVVSNKAEFKVTALEEKSVINIAIYDKLGNTVFRKSGVKSNELITWNLTRSGRSVANGSYLIVAVSKDKNGKSHKHSTMFGVRK